MQMLLEQFSTASSSVDAECFPYLKDDVMAKVFLYFCNCRAVCSSFQCLVEIVKSCNIVEDKILTKMKLGLLSFRRNVEISS